MNVEVQTLELGWAEQRPLCSRAQGTILIIIPGRACRVIINASLRQNQSVSLIAKQKAAFPLVCKRGREKESGENDKLPYHFNFHSSRLYWWRRKWPPTPVLLPGESHGQRSLAGYSPWGRKESDTTEQLNTEHHLTGNVLISSFYLKDHNFAGHITLSWDFFFLPLKSWLYYLTDFWSPKFLMRKLLIILVYDETLFFFCFQDFLCLCFKILSLYSISMWVHLS